MTLFCGRLANESNLTKFTRLAREAKFSFAGSAVKFDRPKTALNLPHSKNSSK
ncbi:MAG: hypothetical protein ACTTJF_00125 [Campylobacter sp.]|uniref:hypothetical protein n=1 Tax=Campylobacter sp. TaxID=205 RepID=UPI003F9EBDA6